MPRDHFAKKGEGPYDGMNMCDIIELLKGGADLEATDRIFNTPLINARSYDETKEILELGANINAQGHLDFTALCMAAARGNSPVCKFLIDAGADVTICTYDGDNVLHVAAAKGVTDICMLLIETGMIDKHCKNNQRGGWAQGATALICAAMGPRTGGGETSQPETCKALLEAGVDVNMTDGLGRTALMHAIGSNWKRNEESIKILMEAGANLNIEDEFGSNALLDAGRQVVQAEKGYWKNDCKIAFLKDLCKLIIEQGGDKPITGEYTKNHCNSAVKEAGTQFVHGGRGGISKPYTALMVVVSNLAELIDPEEHRYKNDRTKIIDLINVLVEAGSDINAATEMGTAWSIAKDWENEDIMKLLVELGANPQ